MNEDFGRILDFRVNHSIGYTCVGQIMIEVENTFAWYVLCFGRVNGSSNLNSVYMYVSIASSC